MRSVSPPHPHLPPGMSAKTIAPRVMTALRRVPFTTAIAALILALAIATRSLWDPLGPRPLADQIAYGLPAFDAGRWWTILTGPFFALQPLQYVPIVLGLLVFGGFAEWRLGSRRAALVVAGCHLLGVGLTAAFLALTRDHGWQWPTDLARISDTGPSAGFLGAAAVATVTLASSWRGRARVVLAAYGLIMLLDVGGIADVEHVFAIAAGLAWGPVLQRRRPRLVLPALTRRSFRLLAVGFFVVAGVEAVVLSVSPASGPLAATLSPELRAQELNNGDDLVGASIQALIWFWLAAKLYTGRRWAWRWAVGLVGLAVLAQVAGIIMLVHDHQAGWPALLYEILGNSAGLAVLIGGRRAFANPSRRRARRRVGHMASPAGEDQQASARALLREEGTVNRLAWMTTWPENRWFSQEPYAGYVAYRVHAGVALGLCDPVAALPRDRSELLAAFADRAHAAGLLPCLFSVTQEVADNARARGWQALKVAEEAVVELPLLEFKGKSWQDVRTALNQAAKLGIAWRTGALADQPRGIQMQVGAISTGWVQDKGLPEMGFTLGGVDEAMDPSVRVGLAVDDESTVHGVTSWMPVHAPGGGEPVGWTLDVMRRLPGGFRYTMEFLISSACLEFKSQGCQVVSLSGAPLARAGGGDVALDRDPLDGFLDRLGATLEPYYGFRSLHAFKGKFQPRFDPLYLVFPDEAALPRIGMALTRAYLPEAGVKDLVTLARAGH